MTHEGKMLLFALQRSKARIVEEARFQDRIWNARQAGQRVAHRYIDAGGDIYYRMSYSSEFSRAFNKMLQHVGDVRRHDMRREVCS